MRLRCLKWIETYKRLIMKIGILILLGAIAFGFSDNLMDRAYGEALMKTLSPALREKLEAIHADEDLKTKSEKHMVKTIKSRLTPEEIKELEAAYRKLILPMLQSTMEKQFGTKFPKDEMPPMRFEEDENDDEDDYQEDSEEVIDEDFLDSSERTKKSEPKISEKVVKEEL